LYAQFGTLAALLSTAVLAQLDDPVPTPRDDGTVAARAAALPQHKY
jgi:hypothetical protein